MQALEEKARPPAKGRYPDSGGQHPASLAQTTYERILARLEGRDIRAVVDATRDLLVNVTAVINRSSSSRTTTN